MDDTKECLICQRDEDEVHSSDRWNIVLGDQDYWVCRRCHSQFDDVREFDMLLEDEALFEVFAHCAKIMRMILKNAPACILTPQMRVMIKYATESEKFEGLAEKTE
jgi:hypothetical protein